MVNIKLNTLGPRAKYEVLTKVQPSYSKIQKERALLNAFYSLFFYLGYVFLSIGCIVLVLICADVIRSPLQTSKIKSSTFLEKDAKITAVTWLHRATMYAESTKENQNANKNTTFGIASDSAHLNSADQVVVCYYTTPENLNTSREFTPSCIDTNMCTHIIVGFASVVNCTLSLDADLKIYKEASGLKSREPKLKVMISVSGMHELQTGFPEMVKNHVNRKKFIRTVLDTLKALNMDGLDLDWEFPAWLSSDNRQKIHFVQLVQELRREFDRSGQSLILSVAVGAPQAIVDQSYNVPEIARHVDFVNVMSYDYHFYVWYLPVTGLNAPLFSTNVETGYLATLNVNFSAHYWMSKGMPKEKIVIGIPTYGHTFKLDNSLNHDVGAPADGFGDLGENGFVSYPVVCSFLRRGAQKVYENQSKVPYSFKDNEWISYDDVDSVAEKAQWIKYKEFKGAMIFSLNVDDWNGTCSTNETFPLTKTVVNIIKGL